MEVYYREGDDETEQPGVLPRVRVTIERGWGRLLGRSRAVPAPSAVIAVKGGWSYLSSVAP